MPMNIIKVNNREYEIPDSWMGVLMSYIELVLRKTGALKDNKELKND